MIVEILRQRKGSNKSYIERFTYERREENETVATMLANLNKTDDLKNAEGKSVEKIAYRQSCLQKKCGSCAMVINGNPRLACDAKLSEFSDRIVLEPLKKFPVIEDLVVDRTIMQENLKVMNLYLRDDAILSEKRNQYAYESARCLQCGLCLEVCPGYRAENGFTGMAGAMPAARILTQLDRKTLKEIAKEYQSHVYEGCGKSLSCQKVCPAGIRIEDMLVNANAIAVWKRRFKD